MHHSTSFLLIYTGYENLFATNAKKAQLKHEDRIFSGSSVTGQLWPKFPFVSPVSVLASIRPY